MKNKIATISLLLLCIFSLTAQTNEISNSRRNVRKSGDVMAAVTPLASLATVIVFQDWQGLKQGAFAGATSFAVSYGLKQLVDKERAEGSNNNSFPSMHTSIAFTGATFLYRRYGWELGVPACIIASYVGWSRTHAKKHDWWDVAAGAAIGIGSGFLYTRPFSGKYNLSISPVMSNQHMGVYASLMF